MIFFFFFPLKIFFILVSRRSQFSSFHSLKILHKFTPILSLPSFTTRPKSFLALEQWESNSSYNPLNASTFACLSTETTKLPHVWLWRRQFWRCVTSRKSCECERDTNIATWCHQWHARDPQVQETLQLGDFVRGALGCQLADRNREWFDAFGSFGTRKSEFCWMMKRIAEEWQS